MAAFALSRADTPLRVIDALPVNRHGEIEERVVKLEWFFRSAAWQEIEQELRTHHLEVRLLQGASSDAVITADGFFRRKDRLKIAMSARDFVTALYSIDFTIDPVEFVHGYADGVIGEVYKETQGTSPNMPMCAWMPARIAMVCILFLPIVLVHIYFVRPYAAFAQRLDGLTMMERARFETEQCARQIASVSKGVYAGFDNRVEFLTTQDVWGTDMAVAYFTDEEKRCIAAISAGPDQTWDTDDDIKAIRVIGPTDPSDDVRYQEYNRALQYWERRGWRTIFG